MHFANLDKNDSEHAALLTAFALQDNASLFETKEVAQKQLDKFPQALKEKALELAKTVTLERIIEDLLLEE